MKRVHEMEVWSAPGGQLSEEYGKALASEMWDRGIPREVFLGLNFIPDTTDVECLRLFMRDGEVTRDAFDRFCAAQRLPSDPRSPLVAARFLEYSFGRKVAWLHLPVEQEVNLLPLIEDAMRKRDLIVVEPAA